MRRLPGFGRRSPERNSTVMSITAASPTTFASTRESGSCFGRRTRPAWTTCRCLSCSHVSERRLERLCKGVRLTNMYDMRRAASLAGLLFALGALSACTSSTPHATSAAHAKTPSSTPASKSTAAAKSTLRYTVVASVQTSPTGVSVLCGPIQSAGLGGPAGPCGRLVVDGMPSHPVPGSRTVGGYTMTPPLRLTGSWDPPRLVLTATPSSAIRSRSDVQQLLPTCGSNLHPGEHRPSPALARRIANDRSSLRLAGSDVYEIATCGASVMVSVPV